MVEVGDALDAISMAELTAKYVRRRAILLREIEDEVITAHPPIESGTTAPSTLNP